MANPNTDLMTYCLPDFSKCGAAVNDVGPAFQHAIDFLTKDLLDSKTTGSKEWKTPFYAFWTNMPLCLGMYCVPCCAVAVNVRNTSAMSGRPYETECLSCCALQCCYLYPCYKAKVRTEFRKKYDLQGSPLMDCVLGCCLGPCTTCQEAVELMGQGSYAVPHCSEADNAKMMAAVPKQVMVRTQGGGGNVEAKPAEVTAPAPAPAQ